MQCPASAAACPAATAAAGSLGSIPAALAGAWCGGSDSDSEPHWTLTFRPDGTFSATNPALPSYGGTAVVQNTPEGGSTLTEYTADGALPTTSISLGPNADGMTELEIGDASYIPGACSNQ